MLRHLAHLILFANSLFLLAVIRWYWLDRMSLRMFWLCAAAGFSLWATGIIVLKLWAHQESQRDQSGGFEVIQHDDDKP